MLLTSCAAMESRSAVLVVELSTFELSMPTTAQVDPPPFVLFAEMTLKPTQQERFETHANSVPVPGDGALICWRIGGGRAIWPFSPTSNRQPQGPLIQSR